MQPVGPNASIQPAAFVGCPNGLIFFGYFTAYMHLEEIQALRARLGEAVPGSDVSDVAGLKTRLVMDFRTDGLTGPEIAVIWKREGWFPVIERSLFVPSH